MKKARILFVTVFVLLMLSGFGAFAGSGYASGNVMANVTGGVGIQYNSGVLSGSSRITIVEGVTIVKGHGIIGEVGVGNNKKGSKALYSGAQVYSYSKKIGSGKGTAYSAIKKSGNVKVIKTCNEN